MGHQVDLVEVFALGQVAQELLEVKDGGLAGLAVAGVTHQRAAPGRRPGIDHGHPPAAHEVPHLGHDESAVLEGVVVPVNEHVRLVDLGCRQPGGDGRLERLRGHAVLLDVLRMGDHFAVDLLDPGRRDREPPEFANRVQPQGHGTQAEAGGAGGDELVPGEPLAQFHRAPPKGQRT